MEQTVIIEFLGLMGKTSLEFMDLKVRLSPHQHPQRINRIILDNRIVMVDVDGRVSEFEKQSAPVKQTIAQRLRLLYNQKEAL